MTKRTLMMGYRLVFGLLTLFAIGYQFVYLAQLGLLNPVNFFSYFTNLSNIFACLVFLIGAYYLARRREPSRRDDIIRGSSVVAMVIVGIVYGILLRDIDLGHLQPWVNVVIHYLMPVAVALDWGLLPPRNTLTLRQLGYWLIYPLIFLAYTLVRGPFAKFYPYPFLDPGSPTTGGYGGVALYCLAIFATFLLVSWLAITLGNRLERTI